MLVLNENAVFLKDVDKIAELICKARVRDTSGRLLGIASISLDVLLKRLYYMGVTSFSIIFDVMNVGCRINLYASFYKINNTYFIDIWPVAYIDYCDFITELVGKGEMREVSVVLKPMKIVVCTDLICMLEFTFE